MNNIPSKIKKLSPKYFSTRILLHGDTISMFILHDYILAKGKSCFANDNKLLKWWTIGLQLTASRWANIRFTALKTTFVSFVVYYSGLHLTNMTEIRTWKITLCTITKVVARFLFSFILWPFPIGGTDRPSTGEINNQCLSTNKAITEMSFCSFHFASQYLAASVSVMLSPRT